jgi:hypothetical protein
MWAAKDRRVAVQKPRKQFNLNSLLSPQFGEPQTEIDVDVRDAK